MKRHHLHGGFGIELVLGFSMAGAFIGLTDALIAGALGFTTPLSVVERGAHLLLSTGYSTVWGGVLGLTGALVFQSSAKLASFVEKHNTVREVFFPIFWTVAVICALFTLYIKVGPIFGYTLIGAAGFLRPLETSMLMGLVPFVASGFASLTLFYKYPKALLALLLKTFATLTIVYMTYYGVASVARSQPTGWVHSALLVLLYSIVALVLLNTRVLKRMFRYLSRVNTRRVYGLIGVVMICLFPFAMGTAIMRWDNHQMRLVLHERSATTYRLLTWVPGFVVGDDEERFTYSASRHLDSNCRLDGEYVVDGVVLIVIDTLRADRIDRVTRGQRLMPNLGRFAVESGGSFPHAYSRSASTQAAFRSMFYGDMGRNSSGDSTRTGLLDVLERADVWRSFVVAHSHLNRWIDSFDAVDSRIAEREDIRFAVTSSESTDAGLVKLNRRPADRPFFLIIHYFDPHAYYVRNDRFNFGWRDVDRYDAEVAYTDFWVGSLLESIREEPGLANSAIIVTSDHGEEFFDHGYTHHGVRLYDESVRVPLIIDLPWEWACTLCERPVSTAELAPTIATLLGVDPSALTKDGARCLHQTGAENEVPVVFEARQRAGLVMSNFKFIRNLDSGILELYDLAKDPGEVYNLADTLPEETERLDRILRTRIRTEE